MKRRAPDDFEKNNDKKRRKLSINSQVLSNIKRAGLDDRLNDVVFIVGKGDDIERIDGNRTFIAAQSDVLSGMLFGAMSEANSKEIIIEDISPAAFTFIRDFCHNKKPELSSEHIIDILYAAQKYLITPLIEQCKSTIIEISGNVDIFYVIMAGFAIYAPSTFAPFISEFVQHIKAWDDIVNHNKCKTLKIDQFKLLMRKCPFSEERKYEIIKLFYENNNIQCDKDNFDELINFGAMSLYYLFNTIQNENVLTSSELLSIIDNKTKYIQLKGQRENEERQAALEWFKDIDNKFEGNKIWIVSQTRDHLNDEEIELGYDGPHNDLCSVIKNMATSGDKIFVENGQYELKDMVFSKNLQIIAIGNEVCFNDAVSSISSSNHIYLKDIKINNYTVDMHENCILSMEQCTLIAQIVVGIGGSVYSMGCTFLDNDCNFNICLSPFSQCLYAINCVFEEALHGNNTHGIEIWDRESQLTEDKMTSVKLVWIDNICNFNMNSDLDKQRVDHSKWIFVDNKIEMKEFIDTFDV